MEELEKKNGQELIDARDYCGVDGYYRDYLENVNAEMLKRFNRLAELEKENRWHDLRKNCKDLPKETKEYLVKINTWGCIIDKLITYNAIKNFWCLDCQQDIIAWCEIPRMDI